MARVKDVLDTATTHHHKVLSLLSVLGMLKTLACSRFQKAIKENVKPPQSLVDGLAASLKVASDHALTIPGALQVAVLKFVPEQTKGNKTKA